VWLDVADTGHGIAASMDRVTWHQEEPLPGVALVAHDHAYHAAAAHGIRVVLEGTGSDEIFAGYPRHQLARIRDHVRRRQWLGAAGELTGAWRRDNVFGPWVRDFVGQSVRRRLGMATAARPGWLGQDLTPRTPATSAPPPAPWDLSLLAQMSFADVTRGNVPAVLTVTDRNAMAHSVESRVPFLDHRVVEFAFGLPDDFKTRRGALKIVLRHVARGRLPALIAERRGRIGFGMPIADWMRHAMKPSLIETVNGPEVTRNDLFDPAKTQRFVTGFLQERHKDVASVWRIYALARWLRAYHPAV
jgi:asparagine synthase (glutamine-hydrolysing)